MSFCVMCKKNKCDICNDPFVEIIDVVSFNEITYDFCIECVHKLKKFCACLRNLDEPWEKIFINTSSTLYYCSCCFQDERNMYYHDCHNNCCKLCFPKLQKNNPQFVLRAAKTNKKITYKTI